eukprot:596472-Pyramimonas_sp.AAC.1
MKLVFGALGRWHHPVTKKAVSWIGEAHQFLLLACIWYFLLGEKKYATERKFSTLPSSRRAPPR